MATDTSIEWADKTWSPIIGCDRVSPGCDACYAISTAHIRTSNPRPAIAQAFAGTTHRANGRIDWTGQINHLENRLTQPLAWKKPAKVFVNSQSDLFHKNVDTDFIARIFATMAVTPQHSYQILTKRHARMRSLLSQPEFWAQVGKHARRTVYQHPRAEEWIEEGVSVCDLDAWEEVRHLPNVWLGVSVENQQWADIRIPALLETPAAVRFLSCEPLLGPVTLADHWIGADPYRRDEPTISWLICGGESGPKARPMHPDWARSLRDQCTAAGVPFLFKQFGEWGLEAPLDDQGRYLNTRRGLGIAVANDGTVYQPGDLAYPDGPRYGEAIRAGHDRAHLTAMYRLGRKNAGRELDGRTWDQFPQPA